MSAEKKCISCGALLSDEAPEGSMCIDCYEAEQSQGTVVAPEELELPQAYPTPPTPVTATPSFILPPAQPMFETIGDFEVIDKLGQGGMGAVYRARQKSFDRLVALKILPAQFEEDEEYVARFQREAAVAASLHHANLVRVYSSGQADGCHFIAMELVEGENLRQRLKRGGMTPVEALRICADVARGLQCGWDKAQLVHRDIKPSNIYLSAEGEVKLGDLGLAKSLLGNTTGLTQTGAAMGTPHYMSPEQARGEKTLDFRADIYSLGCTLFELLTGQPPYSGSDGLTIINQHLNAPLPAILKIMPGCPLPLVRLIGKMLKKHRNERHPSYTDLIAELEWVSEQLQQGEALSQGPRYSAIAQTMPPKAAPSSPSAVSAAPPSARKSPVALYAGIGVAALAIVGALIFTLGRKPASGHKVLRDDPAEPVATATHSAAPAKPSAPARWQALFNGRNANDWLQPSGLPSAWQVVDGALIGGARDVRSRGLFEDHALHLEFTLGPGDQQDNLIFLQNRYGVRVAGSAEKPAGEIFGGKAPSENAGLEPEKLQTLDLVFRASRFNDSGRKISSARVSVALNGKLIQDQVEIPKPSEGGDPESTDPGPLRLAANGNPIRYHKVLVLPLDGQSDAEALRLAKNAEPAAPEPLKSTVALGNALAYWKPVTERLVQRGDAKPVSEGWVSFNQGNVEIPDFSGRNVGVRYQLRKMAEGEVKKAPFIRLRHIRANNASSCYQLQLTEEAGGVSLEVKRLSGREGKIYSLAGKTKLPNFSPGAEHTFEFFAIGDDLIGRCDGVALITKADGDGADLGTGVAVANLYSGELRNIEVLNLEGVPEATALVAAKAGAAQSAAFGSSLAQWIPVTERLIQQGAAKTNPDGWFSFQEGTARIPDFAAHNVGVRYKLRKLPANQANHAPQPTLRQVRIGDISSGYQLQFPYDNGVLGLIARRLSAPERKMYGLAGRTPLPDFSTDAEHTVEFYVVGPELIARCDGNVLTTKTDKEAPDLSTAIAFHNANVGQLRDLEVINLDGLPEAEALAIARTGGWLKYEFASLDSSELLKGLPESKMEGNLFHMRGFKSWIIPDSKLQNSAVRATFVWQPKTTDFKIRMRGKGGNLSAESLVAYLNGNSFTLRGGDSKEPELKKFSIPSSLRENEEATLQMTAIGGRLSVHVNGELIGEAEGVPLVKAGESCIHAKDSSFRSVEILNLDGLSDQDAASLAFGQSKKTEVWKNALQNPGFTQLSGVEAGDGSVSFVPGVYVVPETFQNGAVRARLWVSPEWRSLKLVGRYDKSGEGYQFDIFDVAKLSRRGQTFQPLSGLRRNIPLRDSGTLVELEFRIVGSRLTGLIDGEVFTETDDAALQKGSWGVAAGAEFPKIKVQSVEYLNLDGPSDLAPVSSAGNFNSPSYSQPSQWIDATDVVRNSGTVKAEGEWLTAATNYRWHRIGGEGRTTDVAVKIVFSNRAGAKMRHTDDNRGYLAEVSGSSAVLLYASDAGREKLASVELGPDWKSDAPHEFVFTAQGSTLEIWLDGKRQITVQDTRLTGGKIEITSAADGKTPPTRIKSVQYGALAGPSTSSSSASVTNGWKDVLSLVELPRDAVKGSWSRMAEGISVNSRDQFAVCEIPYEPPAEYDFEVEFTPTSPGNNVDIHLPTPSSSAMWKLNAHGKTPPLYGFDMLNGKAMPGRGEAMTEYPLALEVGRRYTTKVEVRRTGLKGFVNGQEIVSWAGDVSRFSTENAARQRNERHLGLGSYGRQVLFLRAAIREVGTTPSK